MDPNRPLQRPAGSVVSTPEPARKISVNSAAAKFQVLRPGDSYPRTAEVIFLDQASVEPMLVATPKPWDRFFVRMLLGTLVVVVPFVVLAAYFNVRQGGPWMGIAALLVLIGLLGLSTWLTARPVLALSRVAAGVESGNLSSRAVPGGGGETRRLALTFNALLDRVGKELPRIRGKASESANRLSASAEQLATATAEQALAAAQTSDELAVLATSSALIADSVAGVVNQAGELRANIHRAQTDLQGSTDRTLANARRVDEIQGVLELLNDIADQTALLALNAAIEAARAGETGRGFAVVADEVRRLAERSKAAAAQIAKLTQGAQATSAEAVAAIERRGHQLDRWMAMTQTMSEISGKVQPAVQLQQTASDSVKLAIQLIADRSRAVEAAAQEVASTAANQASLAADLAARGWGQEANE